MQFSRFRYNDFAGEWSEGSRRTMKGFRSSGDAGGGTGGSPGGGGFRGTKVSSL